jgi:hypothetical protein
VLNAHICSPKTSLLCRLPAFYCRDVILCRKIRTTERYWKYIVEIKHPESFKRLGLEKSAELVRKTIRKPDVIVREKLAQDVYIREVKWFMKKDRKED